ncbi:polysaccharide lyase family 8 super-sandwich domain-containing protein [uncultured Subdoligranulum sp.]|uniref:polysaccharide lyase family 8 super-sandwich domain-containing protein n=1 Tax=uncultured Subdoligranulum sp. TaxID=512298 RepID=UPI002618BA8D|nr:polysaccharide lyase family 8 super-sandwich domain-containing protein [uncultured Subdoligranulum sp.]
MKASWKARCCCLAIAMALAAGQSLPVYAAGQALPTTEVVQPEEEEAASSSAPEATAPPEEPAEDGTDENTPPPYTEGEAETDPASEPTEAPAEEPGEEPGESTAAEPQEPAEEESPVQEPAEEPQAPENAESEEEVAEPAAPENPASEAPAEQPAASAGETLSLEGARTEPSANAVWSDDFSQTAEPADEEVGNTWKNGVVPANWNDVWLDPAPTDPTTTYWEVVEDEALDGGKGIHLHSEDAAARMDIISGVSGLDYSKDYVLRLRIKTEDLNKLKIRAQVGDKGNIALPEGTIPGGTQDWYDFEMDLADLQEVYDASDKGDKTNENGYLKLEIFSAAGTTGDIWIDRVEIVTKSSAEADKGEVLWSTGFDEAVPATGDAAKYFVDGQGPKGMMGAWVPVSPDTTKFQLKLDKETQVSGTYSLYAKSDYEPGSGSEQRVLLYPDEFPHNADYTQDYLLRAKIKLQNVGCSSWGGAALRVDLAKSSITSTPALKGTSDWQTVELYLSAENLQKTAECTQGQLRPAISYENFTGEVWVDDMELIALPYTLELGQTSLTLTQGDTQQLTTNAPDGETLTWASSDEAVATVSDDGTVTAVGRGVATITATAPSGSSASCTVSVIDAAMESEFAAMRDKWVERLTGNSYWAEDATSEEYKTILAGYDEAAKTAQDHLVDNSADMLFNDLNLDFDKIYGSPSTDSNDSVDYSTAISRIQDMARAWAAKGSQYYQNEELKADILYAMEWAYAHFYNEKLDNKAMFGNWYHWWIGIPQNLAGAVILMHDAMSPELLQKEAAALQHFNEDPAWVYKVKGAAGKMDMTGGNLADTSLASLLRGAACSDQTAVINGTKYFDQIVKVVTSGEGIYADGSFIQHTNLAYTGGYGATLLNGVEKLVYLTAGSGWSINADQLGVVYDWIWNGIRPLYANGAMFDMVNGRGVARPSSSDLKTGRGILAAVTLLAESAPADRKADLQGFAKAQLQAGAEAMGESEYYSGMNAAAMMSALALVNDETIQAVPNTGYAKVFGSMDKAVAHSDTFSFGISYASGRTGRMEFGNEENKTGWHQSDGATYLYNGDPDQYADNYWNTVDPQRLAGITTDHSSWELKAWGNYVGNANFNGGTAVGPYASVAMNFKNYSTSDNPDLTARKAWFVFDDEIVALGAGITGIDPERTTETIVENKKINGDNKLVVDGQETAPELGDQEKLTDVQWAWLAGNTDKDAVGYYFPEGSDVNVLRESRTGKWTDVNGSNGVSEEPVTRNYLSLAIPHGENVNNNDTLSSFKNEYYDYVLLPGKTQEQVAAYAEDPDIEVLSNSTMAQVVRDNSANVTGYIFWGDQGSKAIRVGDVSAVKGSVTIVKDPATHTMTVGMADVHQNNDSLTFRVYGNDLEVVRCDDGVTAETDKYGVVFTVDTADAKGKTFTAEVKYRDLTDSEKTEMAGMRQNYADSQTGNNMTDKTDPQYRAVMDRYAEEAKTALDHLNRSAKPGENLFDDIDVQLDWANKGGNNTDGSANLTSTVSRIQSLALAYTSEGCTDYYHNEDLKEDILFCLDYLRTGFPNFLNYHDKIFANWWDWTIGMPKALSSVGVLMYDELPEEDRDWLYNTLRLLVPDSSFYWGRSGTGKGTIYESTGANQAEQGMVMALAGLIGGDPACLFNASDTLAESMKYVTSGDGFYEDGSYKQHGNFAYTGSYGVEMLRGVTQIASITNNTTWACTDADPNIIYEWILNSFRPLYADGGIMDMVQGRSVSRYNRSTITTGRYAMDAILTLIANAPEEYRDELYSFAKTQVKLGIAYDPDSYYAKLRFSSLIMAKNLLADDSIPLDTELYTKVYGMMDKAVVHARNFALAISMFSSRNGATESINNENLKGWYQSDGTLALHNGDQAQYDKGYWATVDPLRLAGITTNHVTKPMSESNIKTNDRDWVGGSTVPGSNYASIGMDFASNYSDLEAKKSWFALGEQIVALGAGITTTEGDETETIVENRRLDNENTLIVNGSPAAQTNGQKETVNANWAWLSANQAGTAIGYYFPETTALNVLRETRTGKWSDINTNSYPKDDAADQNTVTNDFMSLAVSHGQNPTGGSYSYVLLPGKTQDEMAAYAENNSIRVLANTTDVQAAADTALGVYGFNFWNASGLDLPEGCMMNHVESDSPVSLTLWNENGDLHIGIADPTQKGGIVTVTLLGEGLTVGNARSAGTVTAVEGGIQIQVNMSELNGAALNIDATAPALEPNPEPQPDPGEKPGQGGSSAPSEPQGQTPADNAAAEPEQPEAAAPAGPAVPQTSDDFPLTALVMALAANGAAAAGITLLRKKHRKE